MRGTDKFNHGGHNSVDDYRQKAHEVIQNPESLPGGEKVRNQTGKQLNLLKFQMYYNDIHKDEFDINADGIPGAETKQAITEHVEATQVFLNELGANISEDGILGKDTRIAINQYLGLTMDVSSESTSVIKNETQLPQSIVDLLKNPKYRQVIDKLKATGIIINGDRAVIENPKVLEDFQKYIELLNFIHDVKRKDSNSEIANVSDKEKLMDNYIFLINEGSDWMTEEIKRALSYKYAESIYNDIIRMGSVLQRNSQTGEYEIINIKTGKVDTENPYNRVIKDSNMRNLIDVARVSSFVRSNFQFDNETIIGDKTLITKLLQRHAITNRNGGQIDPTFLLLEKEHVLEQINKKIAHITGGNSTSYQDYQELTFLRDYIDQGEVPRVSYMRDILQQVNIYRGFLQEKAVIGGDWKSDAYNNVGDESIENIISNGIRNHRIGFILLGVLALVSGKKNLAFGSFAAGIMGGTIADVIDTGGKLARGSLTDEDLELVRMSDVKYTLTNSGYQDKYNKLADANKANSGGFSASGEALPYLENKRLSELIDFVTSNDIDIDIADDDATNLNNLRAAIVGAGSTFGFSDEELLNFTKLVKTSGIKDSGDTSLLDYLSANQDIANTPYETISFTGEVEFDAVLNTVFFDEYQGADRETRKKILTARTKVHDVLNNYITSNDESANGYFEKKIQLIQDLGIAGTNVVIAGLNSAKKYFNIAQGFDSKVANIDAYLAQNNPAIRTKIHDTLVDYATYFEARAKVEKYEGVWDQNQNDIEKTLYSIIGTGGVFADKSSEWKSELSTDIGKEIQDLQSLKGGFPQTEPFISLSTTIDTLINNLEIQQDRLAQEVENPNSIMSDTQVVDMFASQNGGRVDRLKTKFEEDSKALTGFINAGNIDANTLQNIQLPYERISRYSAALTNNNASHNDPRAKANQDEIIKYRDTFENTQKQAFRNLVQTQLQNKSNEFDAQKTSLNNIDPTNIVNLAGNLGILEVSEQFINKQVDMASLSAELLRQSDVLEKSWDMLKSAGISSADLAKYGFNSGLDAAGFTWDVIKAGFGTLSYASGTSHYFDALGNKFNQLLAGYQAVPSSNPAVTQAATQTQNALTQLAALYEKVHNVDIKNKEAYTLAVDILGADFSGSYNTSLEDILTIRSTKVGELQQTARSYINDLDVSALTDEPKKQAAISQLDTIKKYYPDLETDAEQKRIEVIGSRLIASLLPTLAPVIAPEYNALSGNTDPGVGALADLLNDIISGNDITLTNGSVISASQLTVKDFADALRGIAASYSINITTYIPKTLDLLNK